MSTCHILCFVNKDRPPLRHSDVTVRITSWTDISVLYWDSDHTWQEVPDKDLGPDLSARITSSIQVDPFDGVACAASARLWEETLEIHRVPYLLLRVADMRMSLGSKVTALQLYEEVEYLRGLVDALFLSRSP